MKLNLHISFNWWVSTVVALLLGLIAGLLLGSVAALCGAMIGAAIGSFFDPGVKPFRLNKEGIRLQHYFSASTEALCGYVLADIEIPENKYESMTGSITRLVKPRSSPFWFIAGRRNSFALSRAVGFFDKYCMAQPSLVRTLCRVLVAAMDWGVSQANNQKQVDKMTLRVQQIQDALDLPNAFFEEIQRQQPDNAQSLPLNTQRAAKVLGISADANKNEIKMTYKRRVRDVHPDRLIARGESEEQLREASAEMDRLRKAYEFLMARP